MKIVFGLLAAFLAVAGVLGGLYVCFYQGWYMGIMNIVDAVQVKPIDGGDLAFGVLRILLASFAGGITAWFFMICSGFCMVAAKSI